MTRQMVVRLEPRIDRLIRRVARMRGQDLSNFVRAIIKAELARLSFLSDFEKKALGVVKQAPATGQKERRRK